MNPDSSHRPRVGIPYRTRKEEVTGLHARLDNYVRAVREAGAEPVSVSLLLSMDELKRLTQTLDGVLLTGSPADVDPARFGAAREPQCADADPDRERTDFALLEHSFAEHKPVLAICFGIQSLNVFLGGTLVQDIPSQLGTQIEHEWHRDEGAPEPFHIARIEPGSQFAQLAGANEGVVNSSHHQSVKDPGRGLRIAARAPDGVIEAVEWTGDDNWVMGVQWHPERMAAKDSFAQSLFRSLASAAAVRKTLART
jgi:putative glutamine amidotransferase